MENAQDDASCPALPSAVMLRTIYSKRSFEQLQKLLQQETIDERSIRVVLLQLGDEVRSCICYEFIAYFIKVANARDCMEYLRPKILILLKLCPSSASVVDKDGCLALHHAAVSMPPDESIIENLLDANPNGPAATNADGHTPLHLLIDHGCPDVIQLKALLDYCPMAARCSSKCGKLPLHLVMHGNAKMVPDHRIVSLLIDYFPEAAHVEIVEDKIQLQLTDGTGTSIRVVDKWSPYSRAIVRKYSQVSIAIEKKYEMMAQQRINSRWCCKK